MKKNLLNLLFIFSYYSGINKLFYYFSNSRQRVITFHNVIPDHCFDNSIHLGVSCTESVFKTQINEILKQYKITTEIGVPNSCVVTFDDGYSNNFENANKILMEKNLSAVFFITSDLIENQDILWVDKMLFWFSYVPLGSYNICGLSFCISEKNRGILYIESYRYILENYKEKYIFIQEMKELYPFSSLKIGLDLYFSRFNALSISEIEEMKKNGHLIACHSTSHDILSKLEDIELSDEILKCEKLISSLYNCNYFSYPFGSDEEVNDKVINAFKDSLFQKCFTNKWNWKIEKNPYSIQRFSFPNTENKYLINAHLSGFYYFIKHIF